MDDNIYNKVSSEYGISPFPEDTVVAMAYVPYQNPVVIYPAEQGMEKGTLFPCLDKPFIGCEVSCQ